MLYKLTLLVLAVASISNLMLGYAAFKKNPHSSSNRLFGLLSIALVGWSSADYLANLAVKNPVQAFGYFKVAIFFLTLQNVFFLLLLSTYPTARLTVNRLLAGMFTAIGLAVAIMPFAGSFFASYVDDSIVPGMGMMILMTFMILTILAGFSILITRIHRANGETRNQMRFLILAAIIVWVLIPIADFILPMVFGQEASAVPAWVQSVAPVLALLFAGTIGYSVMRRRLFDIRPVTARVFSYGIFLITLVIIYVIGAFGITTLLTKK